MDQTSEKPEHLLPRSPSPSLHHPKRKSSSASACDLLFFVFIITFLAGFAYVIIYWAIPSDRRNKAMKEMEQAAAIKGPEVMVMLVDEIKKLREAVERVEGKMVGR